VAEDGALGAVAVDLDVVAVAVLALLQIELQEPKNVLRFSRV
jgi:hypothetical protein